MSIRLYPEAFDPWALVQERQRRQGRDMGAAATFIGCMRDCNSGDEVTTMTLEHYPGMTEKVLREIEAEVRATWDVLDSLIAHRTGEVRPGDPIVLVAVWSVHRKDAFEACRALMERLKSDAPFWKRETLRDGSTRWVETNTAGY